MFLATPRRRAFLNQLTQLGILLTVALLALTSLSCRHTRLSPPVALSRFEKMEPQMGVPFRIVVYATNEAHATTAIRAAYARIAQLNDVMSDYDTDSELSRLSQTSGTSTNVPVSRDLWIVLSRSQELARQTDGAFDVTVGPIVSLWRKARREQAMPRADLLASARQRVGFTKLHLDTAHHTARLDVEEMRLDVGAIAKGYAVDEAIKVLATNGISSALVSGGGDMAASGPPPGRTGWRIELAAIDVTNAPLVRFVEFAHAALATSGDVFQHVEINGVRYSHIVDPHTGLGLTDHSLVRIIARDCTTADSLATAVSVLGPERGIKLLRSIPGSEAQILRAPNGSVESTQTPGLARYLVTGN